MYKRETALLRDPAFRVSLVLAMLGFVSSAHAAPSDVAAAAQRGDIGRVQALLSQGEDANGATADGSSALLWAAYHSDPQLVTALVGAGADANVANDYGVTPLLQASRTGDAAVIAALLDGGADLELAHPEGETALMAAALTGRIDAVRLLLERGADPNAVDTFQEQTALMRAAAEGHLEAVDLLLAAGADPNAQARVSTLKKRSINADFPSGGLTALMWAVRNGHEAVARRLVAGGADLNLTNGDGATAMMIAIVNDRYDFAATLLELGGDANDGSLYHAVEMRDATTDWFARDGSRLRANHPNQHTALDLIQLLLDAGADPNKTFVGQMHSATMCCDTFANASPFYRAAIAADVEALKLLLAHGADLDWTPTEVEDGARGANANVGRAAIIAAMYGGRGVPLSAGPGFGREGPPPFREPSEREPVAAVRLLLEAGASPDVATPDGKTALHHAVERRDVGVLQALTGAGASLDAPNADGKTALQLAEGLGPEPPADPFGPPRETGGATSEELVVVLREAMQAAGAVEPGPNARARAAQDEGGD